MEEVITRDISPLPSTSADTQQAINIDPLPITPADADAPSLPRRSRRTRRYHSML